MTMLIGEYTTKIDEKNRAAVPNKFREELGSKVVISRGYEGCLILVSQENWEKLVGDAVKGPFVSGAVRDTSRFLLAGAFELELDSQGRVVIPKALSDFLGAKEEISFLGLGRWVELWSKEKWQERLVFLNDKGSEIADKLSKIEI